MQEFVVFLIVLAAAVFLARQWWPSRDKDSGCHSCAFNRPGGVAQAPDAEGSTPSGTPELIQIKTTRGADGRPILPDHLRPRS